MDKPYHTVLYGKQLNMTRKTQTDWFEAGVATLIERGASGLKIEQLTARLGVTKGSFYHHFKNQGDFKQQLLTFIEEQGTVLVIDQLETYQSPSEKLDQLMETTLSYPPELEIALRTWALQDEQLQGFQQRVDQQRLQYLQAVLEQIVSNPARALSLAQLLMTVYIGSQQIRPPLQKGELEQLYSEIKQLYAALR